MSHRLLLFFLWIIGWFWLFIWWVSSWPASISFLDQGEDLLWKSIHKRDNGWERTLYSPGKADDFSSYQEWKILLYWQWDLPNIQKKGETYTIDIPSSGQWIIHSLSQTQTLSIRSPGMDIVVTGIGGLFVSTTDKMVANFDAQVVLNGSKLLPSILSQNGKTEFFDLSENKKIITPDLWLVYSSFFSRDRQKSLGNISKKLLDSSIQWLLTHEPESKTFGIFRRDIRVRNALTEIQSLINKIDAGESCGPDRASCYPLLEDVIRREKVNFPEVFIPLDNALQAWIQIDTDTSDTDVSWNSIFRSYHAWLLIGEPRARVIRDKSILEMIQSGTTVSSIETWGYLTQMLEKQKLWSAYSLQIVREMIRIWDVLQWSPDIAEDVRKSLSKSAVESLSNLKSILENTYFTKKEYWFVLRDDIFDSEGNIIQNQVFINDFQAFIQQLESSRLILNPGSEDQDKLSTVRAQLVWFNCIFSRNDEYVVNPRICRTTKR